MAEQSVASAPPPDIVGPKLEAIGHQIAELTKQVGSLATKLDHIAAAILHGPNQPETLSKPDLIQAALLVVAIIGLFYTGRSLRETARGRDAENYLHFLDLIGTSWRRFGEADPGRKFFEFTELMNLLESSCHLHNKKVIRGTTAVMLAHYLRDSLPTIFSDPNASTWIAQARSTPRTYRQIRIFARRHKLDGVPHEPWSWRFWETD